eukprot:NODE_10485_length_1348_cov_2.642097.p1 GENE.NODE_10485_length_1348_cov_2.642097~~NODE_10485_length_1348_cov_2.642097.p1  ORF type:complete len:351 (+),score=69.23 NODE_10485_length_1348_cov_2.642097:95-1054(+)
MAPPDHANMPNTECRGEPATKRPRVGESTDDDAPAVAATPEVAPVTAAAAEAVPTSEPAPVNMPMRKPLQCALSSSDREAYLRDGYIVLPHLISKETAARLKEAIYRSFASKDASTMTSNPGGTEKDPTQTGVAVWFANDVVPPFSDLLCTATSPLGLCLEALLGVAAHEIEFLSVKPVLKTGTVRFASPWHQDWTYWGGSNKISVWIALDDATPSNGCLQIKPRSHTKLFDHEKHNDRIGFDNRLTDEALLEAGESMSVPLETGGAIFFHDLLVHASHPNSTGADRYCLIPTYRSSTVADNSPIWPRSRRLADVKVVA